MHSRESNMGINVEGERKRERGRERDRKRVGEIERCIERERKKVRERERKREKDLYSFASAYIFAADANRVLFGPCPVAEKQTLNRGG
jgi:hypothetical protein